MSLLAASLFDDPMTKWTAMCAAVLTIVYVIYRSGFRKKDPLGEGPPPSTLAQQRAVEREMSNVLVELSEMARQITAQLDTRAAKLEALIQEADQKIARLEQGSSGGGAPVVEDIPPPAPDSRYQMIYDLADQGLSPPDIAARLEQPRGEIELILALRARVGGNPAGSERGQRG